MLLEIVPNFISIQQVEEILEQVWYTGKMMGETVAQTVCGKKTKYQAWGMV